MLTIEWQKLTCHLGFVIPQELNLIDGAEERWNAAMQKAQKLAARIEQIMGPTVAQYCVPFAYRIRFTIQMNAREAMHLIELRTQQQGHAAYRKLCNEMFRLIREKAGHTLIADSMKFVDPADYSLGRLASERREHARQTAETPNT